MTSNKVLRRILKLLSAMRLPVPNHSAISIVDITAADAVTYSATLTPQKLFRLDQDANFHPLGTPSRACAHCYNEFQGWQVSYLSRSNNDSFEEQPITPTTPIVNCAGNAKSAMASVFGPRKDGTPESMGQSVPRDWNWSTF